MSLFTSSAWFIEFPEYDRHFQPDLHCLIFKGILWPFRRCVDLLLSAVCWKLRPPVCVVRDTANTSTSSSPLPADHFHPPVILLSGSGKNRPGLLTGPTCGEWRQSSPCQLWHSHTLLWGPRLTDSTAQWNTTVGQCGGRVRLCGTGRTPLRLSCVYHKITSLHLLKRHIVTSSIKCSQTVLLYTCCTWAFTYSLHIFTPAAAELSADNTVSWPNKGWWSYVGGTRARSTSNTYLF